MSSSSLSDNALSRLASQSDAVGRLAQDSGGFAAVFAAFESKDANAFRWVLDRLEMLPYCELICEWLRTKLCALRCVEVCGPPLADQALPSLEEFAQAAVRLSSNQKALRRVVDAVSCGDADAYRATIKEVGLEPFCHLICQWVCSIGYRRVCEVVCRPGTVTIFDAATELASAGKVLATLTANKKALSAIAESAVALNCVQVQGSLTAAGITSGCEIICEFFCIWRRVWVCRTLCIEPPPILTGAYAIEEAQSFATAAKQLAGQPRALADLVTAAKTRDAELYSAVVSRFGLAPYCWQLCSWVSSVVCYEFCHCVCVPPGEVIPLFTNVGCYRVGPPVSDFNANGTTIAGALAFTGTIPLIGIIPDGTAPQALEYRFTYQNYSGVSPNPNPVVAITGPMVPATQIGKLEYTYWNGTSWVAGASPFYANNPGATISIPQQIGPPLVVNVDTDTDANGWIQIPRYNDSSAGATGLFTPTSGQGLILLDTTKLTNEVFDLTGATAGFPKLTAGETVPPQALSKKPLFQINFECRTVIGSTPVGSNSLNAIALSNTTYSYIKHPEWPGPVGIAFGNGSTVTFTGSLPAPILPNTVTVTAGAVTGADNGVGAISGAGISSGSINYASGAISLTFTTAPASGVLVEASADSITTSPLVLFEDILELDTAGGCTRLDDTIHVLYTAYHPYLGSAEVYLQGPGVGAMTTPPGGIVVMPIGPNQGQVVGTGNGSTATFTGTLTVPVLPGSIQIYAGAATGTDNGSGAISGAGISSGSINYGTGAISITFATAPASGVQVLVDYNTNDSSGTAGQPFNMTGLPPCGYVLMEVATLSLTSGANNTCGGYYGDFTDYIPFCTASGN